MVAIVAGLYNETTAAHKQVSASHGAQQLSRLPRVQPQEDAHNELCLYPSRAVFRAKGCAGHIPGRALGL